jgi:KDEL-tailed cysteine endopeptidase
VAQQPVAVAIEGLRGAFQLYHAGVLTAQCGTALDHGLLAVGYGVDGEDSSRAPLKYWRLKNDFGLGWGEGGYARIARGVSQPGGQCGILLDASYPVLL